MANVIQLKRGAESARSGFTPAAGEPIYVTDENMKNIDSIDSLESALNSIKEYNKLKCN